MRVLLAAVGNPDFGEPNDIGVPRSMVPVDSFRSASNAVLGYIKRNNLGGGNWAGGQIFQDGKMIAHVSYNGRVWKGKSWKSGQEPIYEPKSVDVSANRAGARGKQKLYDIYSVDTGKNVRLTESAAIRQFGRAEWKEIKAGYLPHLVVAEVWSDPANRAGGVPRRAIVSNKGMMKGYWNVILDDAATASPSEAKSYGGTLVEHGLSTKKSAQRIADEVNKRGSFMTGISGFRRQEPL